MVNEISDFRRQVAELSENISDLIEQLDREGLEAVVVSSIRQHRAALDKAEEAFDAWKAVPDDEPGRQRELYLLYMQANLDNSVQMSLLAALLDQLGYIPVVERESGTGSIE